MTSFASMTAWNWLIQFFIIVVALLVANLIRCNVPLFRRSLLPSALLAGLIILCLKPFGFFSLMVNNHIHAESSSVEADRSVRHGEVADLLLCPIISDMNISRENGF